MALSLNETHIESRDDGFINATQLCKAGSKEFAKWYRLDSTKELIMTLSQDCDIHKRMSHNDVLIDIKKGNSNKFKQGTWIHPDLAIQLAQ
jgi:hypothetical protein